MTVRSGTGWYGHDIDREYHWVERTEETVEGRVTEYGSAWENQPITAWEYTLDVPDPVWWNRDRRRVVRRWKG